MDPVTTIGRRWTIVLAVLLVVTATLPAAVATPSPSAATTVPSVSPDERPGAGAANGTDGTDGTNRTVVVERIDGTTLPSGEDTWPDAAAAVAGSGASPADRLSVVIEATGAGAVNVTRLRGLGATVHQRRGALVEASVRPDRVAAYRAIPWVDRVRRPVPARALEVSQGVADVGADAVHDAGVTGTNVSVGVIDTGFDPDHPEIDANVAATRSFSAAGIGGTDSAAADHGTAVTELLVDTAPGADLYLASVDTDLDFLDAVDWLESREVDVVVTSLGFYAQPYDGDGRIAERADRVVANGTAFVNAAGNDGRDHWEGRFEDPDGDSVHNFAGEDEGNTLNGGSDLRAGTRVTATIQWDEWPTAEHDFDLLLVRGRTASGEDGIVAESKRVNGRSAPAERLEATVPEDGRYSLVVRADDLSATATIELFLLDRRRYDRAEAEYVNASSSIIAPATGDRVLAIGACDVRDGTLAPYSARGTTDDGDRGIGVIAPSSVDTATYDRRFVGTSAAAPHAAGVVALAWAAATDPTVAVVDAVFDGAGDEGAAGDDVAWGGGRLNATAAVGTTGGSGSGSGSESLPPVGTSENPPGDPDGDGLYEDVDGSGTVNAIDVATLLAGFDGDAAQDHVDAYDFDGSGTVDIVDVATLLERL